MNQRKCKKSLVAAKDKVKLARTNSMTDSLLSEWQSDCVGSETTHRPHGCRVSLLWWLTGLLGKDTRRKKRSGGGDTVIPPATRYADDDCVDRRSASPQEFTTGASAANATGIESTGAAGTARHLRISTPLVSNCVCQAKPDPWSSYVWPPKAIQNHDESRPAGTIQHMYHYHYKSHIG